MPDSDITRLAKPATAESTTVSEYPLRRLYFYLTEGCNLACRHCLSDAGKTMAGELSAAQCRRLIRHVAMEHGGRPHLSVVIPAYNEAEAITETKLFEFSFTNRQDAIYTKSELLVDDEGKAKRMPWEDWRTCT